MPIVPGQAIDAFKYNEFIRGSRLIGVLAHSGERKMDRANVMRSFAATLSNVS
jgi:hypothetical protein